MMGSDQHINETISLLKTPVTVSPFYGWSSKRTGSRGKPRTPTQPVGSWILLYGSGVVHHITTSSPRDAATVLLLHTHGRGAKGHPRGAPELG